jgi:hypothetical protein
LKVVGGIHFAMEGVEEWVGGGVRGLQRLTGDFEDEMKS